jgi:hypothetical protein
MDESDFIIGMAVFALCCWCGWKAFFYLDDRFDQHNNARNELIVLFGSLFAFFLPIFISFFVIAPLVNS